MAQKEEVEEASVDVYSRDFRPEREVNFRSQRRSRGDTKVDEDDCGLLCDTKRINQCGLEGCLREAFSKEQAAEVFFPCSEGWDKARSTAFAGYKQPRAVVYAEDTTDVQTAVKCAFDNGIKVTARGRGHSFQGWGVVDGYLVVDMSKMCRCVIDGRSHFHFLYMFCFLLELDDSPPYIVTIFTSAILFF